jgi:hypothetical protein
VNSRQIELHQRVHRLRRRVLYVQQTLVRAHLELFARLLVDVRGTVHRDLPDVPRQRDRPDHARARALRRLNYLLRRLVEQAMVVGP